MYDYLLYLAVKTPNNYDLSGYGYNSPSDRNKLSGMLLLRVGLVIV